ncbi:Uncharacterised protein [Mycoplasmopsis maculosa]|uniref:Uncharacterized protein n=1 Tax=Mycoplasmopsis maculosa TaxID=114885 RepID=A0A449B4D6_9BACT|nr:hypothetical protein [Mycoplasmopsis maculosa]VEU75398.1 Uncharacterised protein [Mycoplasmopsis maculosa]
MFKNTIPEKNIKHKIFLIHQINQLFLKPNAIIVNATTETELNDASKIEAFFYN